MENLFMFYRNDCHLNNKDEFIFYRVFKRKFSQIEQIVEIENVYFTVLLVRDYYFSFA